MTAVTPRPVLGRGHSLSWVRSAFDEYPEPAAVPYAERSAFAAAAPRLPGPPRRPVAAAADLRRPATEPGRPVHACDQELAPLAAERLPSASLDEVNAAAALQTRVDRKYVIPVAAARELLGRLSQTHHRLSVAGRGATTYGTIYFDSPDWQSFRAHAQGRRRRWKIRTRLYHEDGFCRLEIKTKDGRGNTVKHGMPLADSDFGVLGVAGQAFLTERLAADGFTIRPHELSPGVRIDYVRGTYCDLSAGTRMTIDAGLTAVLGGRTVRQDPGFVIVETKGGLRPSGPDAELRAMGIRETSLSKYSCSLSLLDPSLPGHRWVRMADRYFTAA
jgi:VTC domain